MITFFTVMYKISILFGSCWLHLQGSRPVETVSTLLVTVIKTSRLRCHQVPLIHAVLPKSYRQPVSQPHRISLNHLICWWSFSVPSVYFKRHLISSLPLLSVPHHFWHSCLEGNRFWLPPQPPYTKGLHSPERWWKYQSRTNSVQPPSDIGSRQRSAAEPEPEVKRQDKVKTKS